MKISTEMVEHVAWLARLAITGEEKEQLSAQLSRILDHMDKLNELDTTEVEPTFHVLDLRNVLRKDEARPGLTVEAALDNAPEREGNLFKVPKIVEG
ncbi:MAG: Asp-tRNA(Asn)/Glu-tRNA(Gln) amidotransferase subunit GatC [Firmicutes bacterium]|nr:Asp-tRNA(Asn)/Glu-tRNA(Gln) amidotransferase subunit GatC [Bacillota bacterium]MCL5040086.1 Asp-tRNA(Asn)/Glu-tRNA(Gln) amidotransferase subunit GatC [Bacillota bacterium]